MLNKQTHKYPPICGISWGQRQKSGNGDQNRFISTKMEEHTLGYNQEIKNSELFHNWEEMNHKLDFRIYKYLKSNFIYE